MRVDDTMRLAAPTNRANLGIAALAGGAAVAASAVVLGLRIDKDGVEQSGDNWWIFAWLVLGAIDTAAGASLVVRYGHRRLGACLLVVGVSALLLAVATEAEVAATLDRQSWWAWFPGAQDWAQPIATGVLAALIPWELATTRRSARYESIWWSTVVLIAVVAVATAAAGQSGSGVDPVDIPTWLVALSATAATGRLIVVWWWRRVDSEDPLPGWLAAGAVAAWFAVVPEMLEFGLEVQWGDAAASLMLLATVPLLVAGAIIDALRRRPGRFHGISHEVISWLVFAGAIVVVYTGIVAGFGALIGRDSPTWLLVATTGMLAVIVEPARRSIRDTADRLVWGERDDPLEVVRGVVEQVGADSGDELLPALVTSLRRDLRLDTVAIDVRTPTGWHRAASSGPPTSYQRVVELEQHGEVVGRLVVGWEYGPQLRARDEHVLAELVGPLGLAVGWVRLAADLRRSSLAIVSAREEERKRLRRDLHDGLGPALTGVSLGLRTAVRQLDRSSGGAPPSPPLRLLEHAANEVDALVDEVKRIVRDLRPTALDQLGLVDAVVEFTRTLHGELDIEVSMPDVPVDLPAAVEVATYRIVTEALTNVVRHARAARCWLTISAGDTIDIDVVDDGVGVDDEVNAGVGWTAMRERAAELGGSVRVARHHPRDASARRAAGGAAMIHAVVRVAIVDDHPMFRIGLAAAVADMDGIELVGEAERADQVPDLIASTSPDVVLLDVRLADASGLEVNRWLADQHPQIKVVMLTMSEDHETALTALRDGASGYLVKGAGPERVEHAVRTAAAGDVVLDQSLVLGVTELAQARRPPSARPFPQLTQREFDILGLIAEGLDNAAIARHLVLSPKTVRNHVSNVFAKIQAPDRPGAIVLARRHGIGT